MANKEPEGLYKGYRKNFTVQIVKFLKSGESFRITGKSGSGKSKYLRYFCKSPSVKARYLTPNKIKVFYVDSNRVFDKNTKNLFKEINRTLKIKGETVEDFENYVEKQVNKGVITYIILDHAENLRYYSNTTSRTLRSIRDKFKYKLAYILAHEKGVEFDTDKIKHLLEISSVEIEIPLLTEKETRENIIYYAKTRNIDINEGEVDQITEVSGGLPKYIKQILTYKMAGVEIGKAIVNVQKLNASSTASGKDYFLEKAVKNMTKLEYKFFEFLYKNPSKVIRRDAFAASISPKSDGSGVSNESIDQIISRLRKKLTDLKMPFKIKTQRGIGYYLE